ncbi:MAG: hypothetical protein GY737_16170 [Desulfobacteraceae bacterium]|nr:hypothetical protein [Desulfobacteraceae bacterium]
MKLFDTEGANTIQLIDGLEISSSIVYNNAAQLTLNNGAVLQILGASEFGYTVGGNILTGAQGTDKTYDTFVQENLGTTVPEGSTSSQGGEAVIGEEGGGGTVEPQYTSVSADIGEKENHGTLDASGNGFKFTDDPNVANFVDISNFSTDDRIEMTETPSSGVNFTNQGADVYITANVSGTVSHITLLGVVDSTAIVDGTEASFEEAIGFDAFTTA